MSIGEFHKVSSTRQLQADSHGAARTVRTSASEEGVYLFLSNFIGTNNYFRRTYEKAI